jgi:hypothetical protein
MNTQAVGLIFLLIGLGFFLSWGNSSGNVNSTVDIILGAIFAIIGFSFLTYRNVLSTTTEKFVRVANQIMDDPAAIFSSDETNERVKHIQAEARKATREIKERARVRVEKIANEMGDAASSGAE